jgi:predicted hotdog family 3-hydroxylacyl-ACP dehydratase
MNIERSWIQANIPRSGNMGLLHAAECWDRREFVFSAKSHLAGGNLLRNALGARISADIAHTTQAMAAQSALPALPEQTPDIGYLTSVGRVQRARAAGRRQCVATEPRRPRLLQRDLSAV